MSGHQQCVFVLDSLDWKRDARKFYSNITGYSDSNFLYHNLNESNSYRFLSQELDLATSSVKRKFPYVQCQVEKFFYCIHLKCSFLGTLNQVQQQPNNTDCGLYMLHFYELVIRDCTSSSLTLPVTHKIEFLFIFTQDLLD